MRKRKETYHHEEVRRLHHYYRLSIGFLLVAYLWILNHYGVAGEFLYDVTGGQVKIKTGLSFWGIILVWSKWLASFSAIIFSLWMAYDRFLKKKKR